MIHPNIATGPKLRALGNRMGREALSLRVQELIAIYTTTDNSYKGAMQLAGQLQVLAEAAMGDEYWEEQVRRGHITEAQYLEKQYASSTTKA